MLKGHVRCVPLASIILHCTPDIGDYARELQAQKNTLSGAEPVMLCVF